MNRSILCTVKFIEKQLEPGKLMAKRVSRTPSLPSWPLSRTAQRPPPTPAAAYSVAARPPQPPLCPSSPTPGPLLSHPSPPPQSPSPSPCRLGTDSPPCVSAWYVPRYGLQPRSLFPDPQISGCKLQVLSLFLLLGGVSGWQCLADPAVGRPSIIIHFPPTTLYSGGASLRSRSFLQLGAVKRGQSEKSNSDLRPLTYPMPVP